MARISRTSSRGSEVSKDKMSGAKAKGNAAKRDARAEMTVEGLKETSRGI